MILHCFNIKISYLVKGHSCNGEYKDLHTVALQKNKQTGYCNAPENGPEQNIPVTTTVISGYLMKK